MTNIKIFALGGLDENGKNLYCVDFNNKLFVVDCGIKLPEESQYGVDFIIPDFTFLKNNASRISAIIITHLHDDIMDGLYYLIQQVNAPIYAPKACVISLNRLFENKGIRGYKLYQLERYQSLVIDGINVTTFGLTHSSPDSIGVAIETPLGNVVFAQQYVIDFDERESDFDCDIGAIAEVGKKGVFCALVEASYADKEGFTAPKHRVLNKILPVIKNATGRVFITCYRQNYLRLIEILKATTQLRKKVFIYDKTLRKTFTVARENYNLPFKQTLEIAEKDFNNNIDDCVILITGSGSEVFSTFHKIAIKEDENIELRETDTVIIASPIVNGTVNVATLMENELYRENVNIVKLDKREVYSVHPSQEDIKMMLYLLKPKYFIPIMGDYMDFINAANVAVSAGYTPDKVIILDNGQVATFADGRLKSTNEMIEETGEVLINGSNLKDVNSLVLKDRESLSSDGVIVIGIAVDYKTKEVIGGPDIQSRGVIYIKDSEYLIKNCSKMVVEIIEEAVKNGTYTNMEARIEMRERVAKYVARETGKRPIILPAIIEINV